VRKEPIVLLVTLALLAGLWFLSGSDESDGGRGRRGARGTPAQDLVAAKSTPGRFVPESEVTWAADASNVFECPTETRDLPPLDLVAPPFPRLPHPGPPLPFTIGPGGRAAMRRTIVRSEAPKEPGTNGQTTAAATPPAAPDAPATQPANEPLVPIGTELSAVDRIKLSIEAEQKRIEAEIRAKQSEEDRRRSLDRLTLSDGTVLHGEMATVERGENRYATKRLLDQIRTDVALTEPERAERLKKLDIAFKEDKRGKLGKAVKYPAAIVQQVTFADTPENRYRQQLLTAAPNDLGRQMELARILLDARLYGPAVDHLSAMRKAGLSSAEMLAALADSQHEMYRYNGELETLRQAVREFPDAGALHARLGRLQVTLGMRDDARASFAAALAKNQADPVANAGMGELLMRVGDPRGAMAYLKEALNVAGSDAARVDAVRLLLAEAYLRQGDFKNAHETVDLVLGRSNVAAPERARIFERAFLLAAIAALGQGQPVEARARAEEGAKRYPLSGQLSYLLGLVMAQQGELGPARSRLAATIDLDPLLTGHAQVAIAMIEEAQGRDDGAVAAAESGAMVASPAATELRLPFGRALLHVGDLARAREQLLAALDHDPRSADALLALGDAAYADGNLPDATRYYDRAASIEPAFPQLLPRRIVTQVRRRKLAEAEDLAAKVGTADLKDPFLQAALAFFQYAKGNQAEALSALQKLGEGDAGPLGGYAKAAHQALVSHQNKTMWTDTFSRTGAQLGRSWNREVGAGVNIAFNNQAVLFEGTQRTVSDKPTIIWQERPGDRVYGFATDLDLPQQPGVYAGVGLMVFNQSRGGEKWPGMPQRDGGVAPYTGLQVALSPDGVLVSRVLVKGRMSEWEPVPKTTYAGGPVRIELRLADPREGVVEVLVNRESVLLQTVADLKRFRRTLDLQVFCYAQIDRKVRFTADNVTIVTLKEPQ
jgi:tetratricopeptide (TPR) repeat protein